ncbi:MAG: hypothetical protein ABIS86_18700 [Streptosporangiaceae bacterium]
MTPQVRVADLSGYLAASGWVRQAGDWRGASVWVRDGDHELLVPARDGMGDGERRVREVLGVLAAVEGRSPDTIATDVGSPLTDVQWYRSTRADRDGLSGTLSLLEGAQGALTAAARAVLSGPRATFEGAPPKEVTALLARVRLAPPDAVDDPLTLRIPLADPLARPALLLLQDAALHVRDAVRSVSRTGELEVFDELVTAGVSANLCRALARFAGPYPGHAFELGFRWARDRPAAVPAATVAFGPEAWPLLRQVGHRLRRLRFTGAASVTGRIGTLYDNGGADRFRVLVHGDVVMEHGTRRSLWVRLSDSAGYDLALAAHRDGRPVRAEGTLATVNDRLELITRPGDFHQLT